MADRLSFLLILTSLTGIHSVTTVKEVSVKAGDSVSIPCLYRSKYINHVKYLCKGSTWYSCSSAVKTNQPSSSGKFSISEDSSSLVFNVTIKNVTDEDTGCYWCAVEINFWADIRKAFHLSVDEGTPRLSVDHQEITGFEGDNITINCHYRNHGEMKWCKLGGSCVTTSSGSIDGTRVTINASVPNVFTVTMSRLRTESSGWYWCANGDLQMPVNVTCFDEQSTTNRTPTTVQREPQSVSFNLKSFVIPLSLLIFTVMVTFLILFLYKRHERTEGESSAKTKAEEDVTYSDVKHVRKTSGQRSNTKSDVDMMYSSVVEANDENVTYSSLAQHQQNL